MTTAFVFPGQGAQYVGMGKELYDSHTMAKPYFETANQIAGFNLSEIMFYGTNESLRETKITQPAIFVHSVILSKILQQTIKPDMVAGHSLGELSALVSNGVLDFESGLRLVLNRAKAMQKACDAEPSGMAAIFGLEDRIVEEVCDSMEEIVVAANYNSPGQVVISGSIAGIDRAIAFLVEKGAKMAMKLPVGGAFHSPFMQSAREELAPAIEAATFSRGICPIYQNVSGSAVLDPGSIKSNLISQLTSPVRWSKTIRNMIADGATSFIEVGPGKAMQGMIKKIDKNAGVLHAQDVIQRTLAQQAF
jgi:[acyl-carrier-protein] S-malonyltransferase